MKFYDIKFKDGTISKVIVSSPEEIDFLNEDNEYFASSMVVETKDVTDEVFQELLEAYVDCCSFSNDPMYSYKIIMGRTLGEYKPYQS